MHDGCSGSFLNGKQVADKVRMMGYADMSMSIPLEMVCVSCSDAFEMRTMVAQCPGCRMVYAVTPCHAGSAANVMPAGIDY